MGFQCLGWRTDGLVVAEARKPNRLLLVWLLSAMTLLGCAACGSSSAPSSPRSASACAAGLEAIGDSPVRARQEAGNAARCAGVKRICIWTIANSQDQTHTTPGSYVRRPPGSCPSGELNSILALAARFRLAGPRGDGVCNVLTAEPLYNAKRDARLEHITCGQAAIQPAKNAYVSAAERISQPLTGILLNSFSPGPPHWFGYLQFTNPKQRGDSRDPRYAPLVVQIIRRPKGNWAINQIGYEF